jgi:hypothetical protein
VIHEHGWDEDRDRADTQAALLDPPQHRINRAPTSSTSSISDRTRSFAPTEPAKRGIITSFAYPGWFRQSDFPGL